MIGKIAIGTSFKGAVEYVPKKEGTELLTPDDVNTSDVREVIRSFNFQRKARPEIAKVVAHICLSFLPDDAPLLTDEFMITHYRNLGTKTHAGRARLALFPGRLCSHT